MCSHSGWGGQRQGASSMILDISNGTGIRVCVRTCVSACLISLPIIALFQGAIPLRPSPQQRPPRERRCWPRPPLHARADDLHFPKVHCPTRSHSVIAPTEPKRGESETGETDWESWESFFFFRCKRIPILITFTRAR